MSVFMAVLLLCPVCSAETKGAPDTHLRKLPLERRKWIGDFDGMLKRRTIRVAIPHSQTLYFVDRGHEKGISVELARGFEQYLNRTYRKKLKRRPLTLYIYPTTRDRLLQDVVNGYADIAIGNLTITDKRKKQVRFVPLPGSTVRELLVTRRGFGPLASAEALSGRTVYVRPSTSYLESLQTLNKRLAAAGKPPVDVALLPDALEGEDVLEMVNAGMLDAVPMDDWIAGAWRKTLPNLVVHGAIVLRDDGRIGWAVRKNNKQLAREIGTYFASPGWSPAAAASMRNFRSRVATLNNNATEQEMAKFRALYAHFEKYGHQYRLDPLLLTAMGYQESQLDQQRRSRKGAIGVMQLMPATGRAMNTGNVRTVEPNIHAGAKYLDHLMTRYFSDANFDDLNRTLFAFAAYNAGPGTIAKHRREAAKRGLDPNVWFDNVELVTAGRTGSETTGYVRNIYNYYTTYKLAAEHRKDKDRARQTVVR